MAPHVETIWAAALLLLLGRVVALPDAATALLALRDATTNWAAATNGLGGQAWQDGGSPCSGGGQAASWFGLTCDAGGQVTAVNLSALGLEGTLPAALSGLPALATLDLSRNKFRGALPAAWLQEGAFPQLAVARLGDNLLGGPLPPNLLALASTNLSLGGNSFSGQLPSNWSSQTLQELDLGRNNLTGSLPPAWGAALPALVALKLEGNALEGLFPIPSWTDTGFATPLILDPRPGNPGLCGPVLPINPDLFPAGNPEQNQPLIPPANMMRTGDNMTHVILTQRNLFTPGTEVTITNWLGSCAQPCSEVTNGLSVPPPAVVRAGLPWPPAIQTNVYDVSWMYNISISDLVALNPNASQLRHSSNFSVPCYPDDPLARFGYYGGSVAFGQFSGGNQKLGSEGLPGAMAAARINGGLPNQFHVPSVYTGSMWAGGNGSAARVLEPVYWFVDLLAPFHVTNVVFTAGGNMRNASIFVGSDSTSVFGNTRVAQGLNLAAGQQLAVAAGATLGRYVILYAGTAAEGNLNLDDCQVYTYETNAAAFKAVTVSGLASAGKGGSAASPQVLADNDPSSCATLASDASGAASAVLDLGYVATVGSVALLAGPNTTAGLAARTYVTREPGDQLGDAVACNADARQLQPGAWTSGGCNKQGRFVHLQFPGYSPASQVIDLCEFQAALAAAPSAVNTSGGGGSSSGAGGGLSGGAIAGIVLGSLAALCLAVLLAAYLRWRHRWVAQQRRQLEAMAEVAAKEAPAPFDMHVHEYGDGDEEAPRQADGSGEPMAVAADGMVVSGPGRAVAPEEGGWDKPVPQRLNELQLIGRFLSTFGRASVMASLSQRSSQESGSRRRAGFLMAKAAVGQDHSNATTDLTKLPPGFLEVSPADIKLVECVGEGSFGEVWLAEYCGALVAVKILAKVKSDFMTHSMQQQLALRNLQKEALLMSKLRHPNVCLYLGAVTNPPCLVMEYCAKCSLDHLLRAGLANQQMAKRLTWVCLLSMALDAAKGMLYLHSRNPPIAHRDLKSANLLVDSQWRVKVADFSLSRALEIGSTAYTVVSTNPRWLAPEVLSGHPGQLPADVWAFGTVLWELCTWRLPFEDLNTFQIIAKVQSQGGAGLVVPCAEDLAAGPFSCYPQYLELMKACWCTDAEARPTFAVIKEQLADMLTAEMLPLQQAAAAAAAEKAAREAAMAAAGGFPGGDPRLLQEQQQHRALSSKRNSNGSSSSGRGPSLGASLGLGSSLHTASGSRSRSHSHGRSQAANGGSAGVNSGGSGGTPGYVSALPPGRRPYG
ncbi:hypothetical protein ABPG75_013634 [Micractinium tetrahymenae]